MVEEEEREFLGKKDVKERRIKEENGMNGKGNL